MTPASGDLDGTPTILQSVDALMWSRLSIAPRVVAPADPSAAHDLVARGLGSEYPATVTAAVVGATIVGLAVSGPLEWRDNARDLLALGVAPRFRRQGLATQLLRDHGDAGSNAWVSMAERDVVEPLPYDVRMSIARKLLVRAGYEVRPADPEARAIDPDAILGERQ
jgi:ribosomal protein S18 acetylase RimI-like enzyme